MTETYLGQDLYENLRDKWVHEDDLVNHRVTWLLTSQAFLLGAFGILTKLRLDWRQQNLSDDRLAEVLTPFSLGELMTPFLSIFVLVFLGRGIFAAFRAMDEIRAQLTRFQCSGRIMIGLKVDVLPDTTEDGARAPKQMVFAFSVAWVLIYFYELFRVLKVLD